MATLQGQTNNAAELSDRLYQNIMSISPSRRPRNSYKKRPVSASSQLSLSTSPLHSAQSQMLQTPREAGYSDVDIIKNRSWSASRVKSSHSSRPGSKRVDAPVIQSGGLTQTLVDSRPLLSPVSAPGTLSGAGDTKGSQLSSRELWNLRGSQVERLRQEWAAIEHCRAMKRASEMVQHRLDPMYRISGSNMPLLARYHVNDTELQRLREMTETNRVLQLDLQRIKYPQGSQSPRREKTHLSKSGYKPESGSSRPAQSKEGDASADKGREARGQIDVLTSPFPQAPAAVGQAHPTSPVSTPEDTPRFPGEEEDGQRGSSDPGQGGTADHDQLS